MSDNKWDKIIKSKRTLLEIDFNALWQYRDLLRMLVYRDFVTYYKQTILGPLWFFIQPLFTAAINLFVFGSLAGLGPQGVPGFLFYMSGPILWQYFQDTFTKTAATFTDNQAVFGKVYFPRLIMPLTVLISGLLKFGVQLSLLLISIVYYYFQTGDLSMQWEIVYFPILLLIIMIMAMGFGLLVSSLTTKYRDLRFLVSFSVQLLMYATPVAYPLSAVPEKYKIFVLYNPMTSIIVSFRNSLLGKENLDPIFFYYSFLSISLLFLVGLIFFNRVEKTFIDTV